MVGLDVLLLPKSAGCRPHRWRKHPHTGLSPYRGQCPPGGVFKDQHKYSRKDSACQELDAAHFHAVHLLGEVVNNQNVQSVAKGTEQHQKVARSDGEVVLDAQAVQARYAQQNTDPHGGRDFFLEKQPADGNQHHIEGGDKAGFSDAGTGHQAQLLQIAGQSQGDAAADAA